MNKHTRERGIGFGNVKVWGRLYQPGGAPLAKDTKPDVYMYR
jgi:hypothetical protein